MSIHYFNLMWGIITMYLDYAMPAVAASHTTATIEYGELQVTTHK